MIEGTRAANTKSLRTHYRQLPPGGRGRQRTQARAFLPATLAAMEEDGEQSGNRGAGMVAGRLVRVIAVLRLIEAQPRSWTREKLAARFGVSLRAIDKDVHLLRRAGVDVRRHHGGYQVHGEPVDEDGAPYGREA